MARVIKLNLGYTTTVSDKDYARVVASGPWFAHVDRKKKTVYAERNARKADGPHTALKLHRLILGLTDPKIIGDHRDGNGLNNCRRNLRRATASQSQCNRGRQSNNTSGVVGVSWNTHARKFEAHVKLEGKKAYLGLFSKLEDAATAVCKARNKKHKTFVSRRAC